MEDVSPPALTRAARRSHASAAFDRLPLLDRAKPAVSMSAVIKAVEAGIALGHYDEAARPKLPRLSPETAFGEAPTTFSEAAPPQTLAVPPRG